MSENTHTDVTQLSYEQARDQLAQVVQQLESGNTDLASALALWERGEALAAHCEAWLLGAKEKLAQVTAARLAGQSGQPAQPEQPAQAAAAAAGQPGQTGQAFQDPLLENPGAHG